MLGPGLSTIEAYLHVTLWSTISVDHNLKFSPSNFPPPYNSDENDTIILRAHAPTTILHTMPSHAV